MFRFFFNFYFFTFITIAHGSEEYGKTFIKQLSEWNIDYLKLDNIKAGAACMKINSKTYDALGLSYNLADIKYAKEIALQGCEQMKKQNKILSECKCEIIFINDNLVIKE